MIQEMLEKELTKFELLLFYIYKLIYLGFFNLFKFISKTKTDNFKTKFNNLLLTQFYQSLKSFYLILKAFLTTM